MPAEDVNRRKDRVMNEARKVVENINAMSFMNLDDQQVHSLMMMREIARGIVNNKVAKVTKGDVKKALSSSIEKMVGSCKDVNSILSRIPCEGMDDEQTQSVSRMKEIASTIVTRRAKVTSSRLLLEPAYRSTTETVESKMALDVTTSNKDIEGIQRRLFETEAEPLEYDQTEGQDVIMVDASHSSNGNVQVGLELAVVDGATAAGNEVQIAQTEGMMFDDVELVVETEVTGEEDGQNEKQEIANGTSEERSEAGQIKARKLASVSPLRLCVVWPLDGKITLDWVKDMMAKFELSSKKDPPSEFWSLMDSDVVDKLVTAASDILSKEPNCVEVDCHGEDSSVIVVGDIEGQFHDLLNIFRLAGLPSENQFYVFNGNYVDRGGWGLEAFLVLLALKVLMPNRVYLLRGNHETKLCTTMYGFEQEVKTKFGEEGEMVYQKCLECFKELPLASIISNSVYTTHGGLFRSTRVGPVRRSKRKRAQNLELGSLEELSKVERFLIDPPDGGPSILADILWSDPSKEDGLVENADKQRGLSWGPDCTETFLKEYKLKLIIRSHQSPDARAGQNDFGDLLCGYSEDHVGESGKLYTLFSAPDYPQFGEPKYNNEGAYAVLKAPNFDNPSFHSFKGVRPPKLTAYGSSSSQTSCPAWMISKVDFEALGISNPPSWNFPLADNAGGTNVVEVLRAPAVEGIPLPSELQEPHKAAFEYLFELVAGLKYMLSTRAIESGARESAMEVSVPNENEGQNIPNEKEGESIPNEKEEQSIPDETEGENMSIEEGGCNDSSKNEGQNIPDEKKGQDAAAEGQGEKERQEITSEKEEVQEVPTEREGLDVPTEMKGQEIPSENEEQGVPTETKGQDVPGEKEGQEVPADKEGQDDVTEEKKEVEKEKEKEDEEEQEIVCKKEKGGQDAVTEEEEEEEEEKEKEKEEKEKEEEEREIVSKNEKEGQDIATEKEKEKEKEKEEEEKEEEKEIVSKNEKEGQDVPSEKEGLSVEGEKDAQSVPDEKQGQDVPKEKEENNKGGSLPNEKEGKKTTNKKGGKKTLKEDEGKSILKKNEEQKIPSENKAKKHKAESKPRE